MRKFITFLLAIVVPVVLMFGNGQYDVRFKIHDLDCANDKLYVDLELRAESAATTFNVADQNYRFRFGAGLANPTIDQELYLSGIVITPTTISLYDPHNLTGSNGDLVTYNVTLAGGDGTPVGDLDYISIGRISLDIIDYNECLKLTWNDHQPVNFPPTFIGSKVNNTLYSAAEGSYGSYLHCTYCGSGNTAPETKRDKAVTQGLNPVQACVLNNDGDIDGNLDPSSLSIVTPPVYGTATVDASNCIVYTPTGPFRWDKLRYQVCDDGISIPATKGDDNPTPVSLPDPLDPAISSAPPLCSTGNLYIRRGRTGGPIGGFKMVIEEDQPVSFDIYPNPADQHITVQVRQDMNTLNHGTLMVFNTVGQSVFNQDLNQLTESSLRIDTGNWAPGIYVIKWYDAINQYYTTSKFVISH